jgi:hypothetical protein
MNNKKNIDQLFQDTFKNFEAKPASEVWEAIEAKLDEKKKKRILPFWWKFSGVAAVLLIGLFMVNSFYNHLELTKSSVVIEGDTINSSSSSASSKKANQANPKNSYHSSNLVVSNESTNKTNDNLAQHKTITPAETIVESIHSAKNKGMVNNSNGISYLNTNRTHAVHATHYKKTSSLNATEEALLLNTIAAYNKIKTPNNFPVKHSKNEDLSGKETLNLEDVKGNHDSSITIVTLATNVNDTCQNKGVANNALEELLNEKESKSKQQPKENSWQIASTVAPVFLGSVTNGSPLDPMFENNTKTYNTSFSMGVGITYALTNKFSVRTGINKMALSYNTNGIAFFADLQDTGMANINPSSSGKGIKVENVAVESGSLLPFENAFVHKNEGYVNQKIGYYEVPFEITYALINKRFGIRVIGGLSTFFLNENNISVISENLSTNLGKANNLNDIHFSSNLGLGLKYGFMKSLEFSVEPTIKYQLNTFSSNAGNFKPYMIGLYSGISYKF